MNTRQAAAEAALLAPDLSPIGPFSARKFSGGDMLLASQLQLILASGDPARIAGMTPQQQSLELLQIGALLCCPVEDLRGALWKGADFLREKIEHVLFTLTADQTHGLVAHVARFFSVANEVSVEVEEQPQQQAGTAPKPEGN